MADSIREKIMQKVQATLDAAGKPTGLTVHRQRTRPIQKDVLPAHVPMLDDEALPREGGTHDGDVERRVVFIVQSRAQANEGTPPDQALDPLVTWAVQALMADRTLGGLLVDLQELGTEWDAAEADAIYAGANTRFEGEYHTDEADPTVAMN